MKTSKPKKKKRFTASKRGKLIVVAIFAAVIAGLILVNGMYHHIQTNRQFSKDKVRFANTKQDLASIYASIVRAVGRPYDTQIDNGGCAYGALKFARGDLSCGMGYYMVYEIPDIAAGKGLTLSILDTITNTGKLSLRSTVPYDRTSLSESLMADYYGANNMSCSLDYSAYSKGDYNNAISPAEHSKSVMSGTVATYRLGCTGAAVRPVYQLDKSTE